ncbi:gliding motility lipoprotein GldH [Mucilaginibacter gotjawali]|uniref:Gliding motility-associated lipoprotein GldH n=1 Tax=Mucilaginibacter gotjawali TaxID=1550579 RepID=A0A839SDE9_9SPHI|nr:gliding motility lipoprotein GldH [Mucilaginibacter gotjawali]MBB3054587.1 gliding motility-associated lipoprotein GldH [Mucilaginibacter gotjawali]
MKRVINIFFSFAATAVLLSVAACTDKNAVIDKSSEVENHNWTYINRVRFDVKIDDEKIPYNLEMNLRVTGDYKYSNIFVLITQVNPDKKTEVTRYELKLANKEGEWLGKGSGDLYAYQAPFRSNYKFPAKGVYTFYIEQNMRDNPLREVSDVGLRVERVQ